MLLPFPLNRASRCKWCTACGVRVPSDCCTGEGCWDLQSPCDTPSKLCECLHSNHTITIKECRFCMFRDIQTYIHYTHTASCIHTYIHIHTQPLTDSLGSLHRDSDAQSLFMFSQSRALYHTYSDRLDSTRVANGHTVTTRVVARSKRTLTQVADKVIRMILQREKEKKKLTNVDARYGIWREHHQLYAQSH